MTMGTVSAGATCAATTGNGCFQMHVSAVPDGPAFGDSTIGVLSTAFVTFDRCIRLRKGADSFKFMIAIFADIFVNRHFYFSQRTILTFAGCYPFNQILLLYRCAGEAMISADHCFLTPDIKFFRNIKAVTPVHQKVVPHL